MQASLQALASELADCMLCDLPSLAQRMRRIRSHPRPQDSVLAALAKDIERSRLRLEERKRGVPMPVFDAALPVAQRRQEIARAIEQHKVVIVCGETGSGKTTQVPKICLQLGRGAAGMIACTQPRRIAARSVANRLATELGSELGNAVGYKVRFSDRVSQFSYIKVLTDGVLLAEIHGDPDLRAYDTIIIDEAHERSLNIDFLLGYSKQLLRRRPELKLIITSATIDAQKFSRHFDAAPVIEVSGRTYLVEVRWRPPGEPDLAGEQVELKSAVLAAVDELCALRPDGDVLVFLPGEREIRDTAEALRKHHPQHTEVVPLFARLSTAEQDRVFRPAPGRRIVLATNVAETSLTVPGIRYVVDSGQARILRYSVRNKVNQLHIENVSRASAQQRAGRCGRLSDGVCIRLYSEEDFAARAEYTTPEILRTSLAAVILRMHALELGDVAAFPFIDPPLPRAIDAGYQLLAELGAVDDSQVLTPLGRELARFPIDPKIARMLVAGRGEQCLSEMLVICAALSVQDPRERPVDQREAAQEKQRQFDDDRSGFLSYLKLWTFFDHALKHKKSNHKLAQLCWDNFLSLNRMREWRDIHGQLHSLAEEMGMHPNDAPASYEQIHRALLSGLLGHIGTRDVEGEEYVGARQTRFRIFPGSAQSKLKARWIMAAELVETTRLYARCVARIEPEWVEQCALKLVKRSYFDPHWEKKAGQVAAYEKVTLYGLTLVARRRVHFGPIAPAQAREIFIRSALVAGDFDTGAAFFEHNRRLVAEIEDLENRSRRRDVLVDEQSIFSFYDALLPPGMHSAASFEKWRKEIERGNRHALFLKREDLMQHGAEDITEALYPAELALASGSYRLAYRFEPGHPLDGVTVDLPLYALTQIESAQLDWLVPGFLRDKVTALLRGLPQRLRREFVPLPQFVTACLEHITPGQGSLIGQLTSFVKRKTGLDIPADAWPVIAQHLHMNIRVVDDRGEEIAMGRDAAQLQQTLGSAARAALVQDQPHPVERSDVTRWDFDDLPARVDIERSGRRYWGYPALLDCSNAVSIRLYDTEAGAAAVMRQGLARLLLLELPQQAKSLARQLAGFDRVSVAYATLPDRPACIADDACRAGMSIGAELKDDVLLAAAAQLFPPDAIIREAGAFAQLRDAARSRLSAQGEDFWELVASIIVSHQAIQRAAVLQAAALQAAQEDMREQLRHLVFRGFARLIPRARLVHYPRYLKAIQARLEKLQSAPSRDQALTLQIAPLWQNYLNAADNSAPSMQNYRWMLEELRVSLFAQELKTPFPVSLKRAHKLWGEEIARVHSK